MSLATEVFDQGVHFIYHAIQLIIDSYLRTNEIMANLHDLKEMGYFCYLTSVSVASCHCICHETPTVTQRIYRLSDLCYTG